MIQTKTRRIRGAGRGGPLRAAYEAGNALHGFPRCARPGRIEDEQGSPAPRSPFRGFSA